MAKQLEKIEKIQERALRFLHDDYVSDYLTLVKASCLVSMEVKRMRYLHVEIYTTLNDLNPGYMKDIFQVQQSAYSTRRPYNMKVLRIRPSSYDEPKMTQTNSPVPINNSSSMARLSFI